MEALNCTLMHPKDADPKVNSVDPDQTAPDLSLLCLPRPLSTNIKDHYCINIYQGLKNLKTVTRPASPNVSNAMVNLIIYIDKIQNFNSPCSLRHS